MALEVIGAGFGRTSTLSLKTALDMLGYRTHHMKEVVAVGREQDDLWVQAARRQVAGQPIDWRPIFGPGGFTAAVDWPSARFYKELFAANPGAKVILTVRDSADKWHDSVLDTIWMSSKVGLTVRPPPYLARFFRNFTSHYDMVNEVIWQGTFKGRIEDREFAKQVYEDRIAEVKRSIPADRLLVFHPRDGWGPLCAFLGKPVPQVPYPNVNDTEDFRRNLGRRARRAALYRAVITACNAAVAAAAVGAATLAGRALLGGRSRRSLRSRGRA